uniref:DUF2460 domain-containing protein n=1 Tax=viral metagenome TaxID=1070528 RepID=A0A6M3JEC7_9ZZZZ
MATFPSITPQYPFVEVTQYGNLVNDIWGKEKRRNLWGPKKGFHLKYDHISLSDARSIVEFFNARRGNYESFTWTNPLDDVSYTIRFVEPTLIRKEVGDNAFNIEFDLVEEL